MTENVFLNIKSNSAADGEDIELFTKGEFCVSGKDVFIRYLETGDSYYAGNITEFHISGNDFVEIHRSEDSEPMRVCRDRRSLFRYVTEDGEFYFGIIADYIKNELTEDGGTVSFKYLLDVNNEPFNEIEMTVAVRRMENEQCN